ncbi:c6 zinc finger domain containing protein [Niveomyces insectorum RCEF 264]|uniref:C6 zinc finger domain containing protein n=1 Tax=Niveomyces insectorum RCEF 264 TaxID=1081102 RepID=A0A167WA47_9HYPO|nr:c6 zinc finger domain containing protein [Niveomyces insectorum RCEF 264]
MPFCPVIGSPSCMKVWRCHFCAYEYEVSVTLECDIEPSFNSERGNKGSAGQGGLSGTPRPFSESTALAAPHEMRRRLKRTFSRSFNSARTRQRLRRQRRRRDTRTYQNGRRKAAATEQQRPTPTDIATVSRSRQNGPPFAPPSSSVILAHLDAARREPIRTTASAGSTMNFSNRATGSGSRSRSSSAVPPNAGRGKLSRAAMDSDSDLDPDPGTGTSTGTNTASASTAHAVMRQLSKRRRGAGLVTPNACNECRKKRVKRNVECVYEQPIRRSKEDLRSDIERLSRRQRASDVVLSALRNSENWREVLQKLRSGEAVDGIADWVEQGSPRAPGPAGDFPSPLLPGGSSISSRQTRAAYSSVGSGGSQGHMQPSSHPSSGTNAPEELGPGRSHVEQQQQQQPPRGPQRPASQESNSPWGETISPKAPLTFSQTTDYQNLDRALAPVGSGMRVPATSWTDIPVDSYLVQHLLALYFCWEYPTFASLSKEHFLQDFQDGRRRYCSSILVNALLALGCRFSAQPNTRAVPSDPYSSGDHFFEECRRLLWLEDNHRSLTTIQALGIMAIREASRGRDAESWHYAGQSVRLAFEMGLHRVQEGDSADEDHSAVQAATFWGAFALDQCFCELSELVHDSLYILHSPGWPLTSRDILSIYTRYLHWYGTIPEVLRLGQTFTPAVLFAHMYYHFAILLVFRPLLKLRILGSSVLPKDVCLQAADAIQGLLKSYSQLYTLRRTPTFVPYFALTSSIVHLAIAAFSMSGPGPPHGNPAAAAMLPGAESRRRAETVGGDNGSSAGDNDDNSDQGMSTKSSPGSMDRSGDGGGGRAAHETPRLDPSVVASINRGIADLTEMVPCHCFAEQALGILRYLARKWNIAVDMAAVPKPAASSTTSTDSTTSPAPTESDRTARPLTTNPNDFSVDVGEGDFGGSWDTLDTGVSRGLFVSGSAASASLATAADCLKTPLFWPFSMQDQPTTPSVSKLKEAGFALL